MTDPLIVLSPPPVAAQSVGGKVCQNCFLLSSNAASLIFWGRFLCFPLLWIKMDPSRWMGPWPLLKRSGCSLEGNNTVSSPWGGKCFAFQDALAELPIPSLHTHPHPCAAAQNLPALADLGVSRKRRSDQEHQCQSSRLRAPQP